MVVVAARVHNRAWDTLFAGDSLSSGFFGPGFSKTDLFQVGISKMGFFEVANAMDWIS